MVSIKQKTPKADVKGFLLRVMPTRDCLNKAINMDGFCDPRKCWHFVAISALMEELEPGAKHFVKVDAGHVKLNYRGWRYIADTPRHVKQSLLLFDKKLYDQVYIRQYTLRFRRTTKIIPVSRERQDQVNAARRERIAAGGDEARRNYPNMRKRVEGFSGIV